MQIYTTRKVNNQVDFRIVSKIIKVLMMIIYKYLRLKEIK